MIRLREFVVKRDGRNIFDPVSLTVEPGERLGLAGESGCGKTTILKAVTGLPGAGAATGGEFAVRGRIGYVPQESPSSLSPYRTLLEQVADAGRSQEKARSVLDSLGMAEERLLRAYPHQVSGGQRQRVLIAQALATAPDVLVCDEPVAHLDSASAARVLSQIDQYVSASGAGLLVASHREEVFRALGCRVHRMTPVAEPRAGRTPWLRRDEVAAAANDLSKTYFTHDFLLRPRRAIRALQGVSLVVHAGETVAITGPSGAGKSTLVRCLTQRERPDTGSVCIPGHSGKHKALQLIPQECSESLNPRVTVERALREANQATGIEAFPGLGLPEVWARRNTCQLSTGQRARVAIARALAALEGGLLILDESFSGLDMATAEAMMERIRHAQREKGFGCILISHEDSVIRAAADRVVRMEDGRIVG